MRTQTSKGTRPGFLTMGALGVAGLLLAGCSAPKPAAPAAGEVSGLRIERIELQSMPDEIEAPGSVIAISTAQVAARTMGTVLRVAVREGDVVERGQELAQLDAAELVARRAAAQAALQGAAAGVTEANQAFVSAQAQAGVAQKTYERYVVLRDQRSVSPQEFDEIAAKEQAAQAGLAQAQARVRQAKADEQQAASELHAADSEVRYARIVAPFGGRIVRRTVEPGSLVAPDTVLFVVEDTSRYQLEVAFPSNAAIAPDANTAGIRRGAPVRVELDALPGKSFAGKVAEIEAGADPSSHTLKARIDLPQDGALQSGLFGRAWFRRGERRAMVVPGESVLTRGQLRGVFVVDSAGLARWRVVTPGRAIGEQEEILSGLEDGERIVVNPGSEELDGKKVAGNSGGPGESHP